MNTLVDSIVAYLRWQASNPELDVVTAQSAVKPRQGPALADALTRSTNREFSRDWEVHVDRHPAGVVVSLHRRVARAAV